MTPLYVSYHTPRYAPLATRLAASLDRFGLEHRIEASKDKGGWWENVRWRPAFLRDRLERGRPLVWVDADAEILRAPSLFDALRCDVACHVWERRDRVPSYLVGTVFLSGSPKSIEFLGIWEKKLRWSGVQSLQPAFGQATRVLPKGRFQPLPVEYCFINDTHAEIYPRARPVIVHYQHSRVTR